jgi:hypothetical protein
VGGRRAASCRRWPPPAAVAAARGRGGRGGRVRPASRHCGGQGVGVQPAEGAWVSAIQATNASHACRQGEYSARATTTGWSAAVSRRRSGTPAPTPRRNAGTNRAQIPPTAGPDRTPSDTQHGL